MRLVPEGAAPGLGDLGLGEGGGEGLALGLGLGFGAGEAAGVAPLGLSVGLLVSGLKLPLLLPLPSEARMPQKVVPRPELAPRSFWPPELKGRVPRPCTRAAQHTWRQGRG